MTGLEAKNWFHSWLWLLRSSENCIVTVTSISRRINQSQCSIPGLVIGWFFLFCHRLQVLKFHWFIRGRAQWNWKNWKCSDSSDSNSVKLMTLKIEDPDFWYSLDIKLSYNSDYKSDSIASENHPLNWEKKLLHVIDKIKRGPWLTKRENQQRQ